MTKILHRIGLAFGLCAFAGSALAGGPTILVAGNEQEFSRLCSDHNNVEIAGNQNKLTLTGECGRVQLSGNDNTVSVEAAAAIALLGNNNTLTWQRGVGGKDPKISNAGSDNRISRAAGNKKKGK